LVPAVVRSIAKTTATDDPLKSSRFDAQESNHSCHLQGSGVKNTLPEKVSGTLEP
jgi:hypothetical protein